LGTFFNIYLCLPGRTQNSEKNEELRKELRTQERTTNSEKNEELRKNSTQKQKDCSSLLSALFCNNTI
jgi:hypothetical protein